MVAVPGTDHEVSVHSICRRQTGNIISTCCDQECRHAQRPEVHFQVPRLILECLYRHRATHPLRGAQERLPLIKRYLNIRFWSFGGTRQGGKALLSPLPADYRAPQIVGRNQTPRIGMRVKANAAFWQRIREQKMKVALHRLLTSPHIYCHVLTNLYLI